MTTAKTTCRCGAHVEADAWLHGWARDRDWGHWVCPACFAAQQRARRFEEAVEHEERLP